MNNSHQHHTLGMKTHPPSGLLIPWTSCLQPCSDLPQVEFPAHNMLVYTTAFQTEHPKPSSVPGIPPTSKCYFSTGTRMYS